MRVVTKLSLSGAMVYVIFYLIASGCTWVTFTAEDRLMDKIAIKSDTTLDSIFLEFSDPKGKMSDSLGKFQEHLKENLATKGYKIVSSPTGADLVAKFNTQVFMKNSGTQYFFLGLIPTAGIEGGVAKVEGIQVDAHYLTDSGQWHKTYRAYNSWKEDNYIKLATAIIEDFNQAIMKKKQSQ